MDQRPSLLLLRMRGSWNSPCLDDRRWEVIDQRPVEQLCLSEFVVAIKEGPTLVRHFAQPLLSLLVQRTLPFLCRLLRLGPGPRHFHGEPWALRCLALSNLSVAVVLPLIFELQLEGLYPLVCEILVWVHAHG